MQSGCYLRGRPILTILRKTISYINNLLENSKGSEFTHIILFFSVREWWFQQFYKIEWTQGVKELNTISLGFFPCQAPCLLQELTPCPETKPQFSCSSSSFSTPQQLQIIQVQTLALKFYGIYTYLHLPDTKLATQKI